jgi:hypothetical protein
MGKDPDPDPDQYKKLRILIREDRKLYIKNSKFYFFISLSG